MTRITHDGQSFKNMGLAPAEGFSAGEYYLDREGVPKYINCATRDWLHSLHGARFVYLKLLPEPVVPWRADRLCRTCRYWEGARCHRYPPPVDPATDNAFWPSTGGKDWCGEHEYSAEEITARKGTE